MRLQHAIAFSNKLRWLTQTKVIILKTQLHAVNACVKRSSQRSFKATVKKTKEGQLTTNFSQLECFEEDVKYVGGEIQVVSNISSHLMCQDLCKATHDCLLFTYDVTAMDCQLKSVMGERQITFDEVISGPSDCNGRCNVSRERDWLFPQK